MCIHHLVFPYVSLLFKGFWGTAGTKSAWSDHPIISYRQIGKTAALFGIVLLWSRSMEIRSNIYVWFMVERNNIALLLEKLRFVMIKEHLVRFVAICWTFIHSNEPLLWIYFLAMNIMCTAENCFVIYLEIHLLLWLLCLLFNVDDYRCTFLFFINVECFCYFFFSIYDTKW